MNAETLLEFLSSRYADRSVVFVRDRSKVAAIVHRGHPYVFNADHFEGFCTRAFVEALDEFERVL